jgi:hypothetical protein
VCFIGSLAFDLNTAGTPRKSALFVPCDLRFLIPILSAAFILLFGETSANHRSGEVLQEDSAFTDSYAVTSDPAPYAFECTEFTERDGRDLYE